MVKKVKRMNQQEQKEHTMPGKTSEDKSKKKTKSKGSQDQENRTVKSQMVGKKGWRKSPREGHEPNRRWVRAEGEKDR